MQKTISITVKGKVQGVFFRKSTKEKADELRLSGEVKNLNNGDVAIVATGTNEQLKELIDWAHQGPPRSDVHEVIVTDSNLRNFNGFLVVK